LCIPWHNINPENPKTLQKKQLVACKQLLSKKMVFISRMFLSLVFKEAPTACLGAPLDTIWAPTLEVGASYK